jgi:fatty acid desaturase
MRAGAADILSKDEMADLRRHSDLRGVLLVAHAWTVIFGSMAALAWAWSFHWALAIPVWLIGIMLVGGRQLGIAILMHDAAHRALAKTPWLNDCLGQWFCAWPVAAELHGYRAYHLQHHRKTQQADDPDIGLSAPFPITRVSLWRKILRDITGQTTLKQRTAQIRSALGDPKWPWRRRATRFLQRLGGPILVNAILFALVWAAGHPEMYLLLWVVPFFTWLPLITRLRNIAEHAVVPDNDDPFRNARTTIANPIMRAILAPYWVNYHVEHHLLMWVPGHQLPKLHRMLLAKGYRPKMEIQPGYLKVLAMASSALPSDGKRPTVQGPDSEALAFNNSNRRQGGKF